MLKQMSLHTYVEISSIHCFIQSLLFKSNFPHILGLVKIFLLVDLLINCQILVVIVESIDRKKAYKRVLRALGVKTFFIELGLLMR